MATVTGYTATRMKAIEDATVISGEIINGVLYLTTFDATVINAGPVEAATIRDTSAALAAANDTYPAGLIIEATDSDPPAFKRSDGVTAFNSLPWFRARSNLIRNTFAFVVVNAASGSSATDMTSLGSLSFDVGSVPWLVRLSLGGFKGDTVGDTFNVILALSDNTILDYRTVTTVVNGKYMPCPVVEALIDTPGSYIVKARFARAAGGAGVATFGASAAVSFLEAGPVPG